MPTHKKRRIVTFGLASLGAAALAACSPVKLLNAAIPSSGYRKTSDIAYGSDRRQVLDVYVPAAASPEPRPVVVFFYGGSWQNGDRGNYLFVAQALTSRGYVAVLPDYRTYPETAFPGFVNDAAAATRWTRDHAHEFGGDPSRLFVMGHSAGAHLAALIATDPRYLASQSMSKADLRGVIGLAGPYDFLPIVDRTLLDVFPAATRAESQPINYVTGHEPPMFLAAGTDDTVVDPGNTDRLAAMLRKHGDSVEVRHYDGFSHIRIVSALALPLRGRSTVLADVAAFIDSRSSGT
ncbi:alpha/beta hydrolase [Caballeronia sordidicola]|jgi:acetyl esterase/lipase|uniref:Esterase/lipase/thioesterase family protein n=1 Tax=Caballeronia sordidicola TaxID=196367 RepID=A0A226WVA0_CABSO|nr:alpha/beta hydrolase [Caballeronia sordidicola]OXC75104.1 Esterase/lipase/thioesterase family protein [Caballeronia sordidicola]